MVAQLVNNLPAKAGDARDLSSIPGSERSPGEGNGSLLQYYCLEDPMDRGAWLATVYKVAKSQTRLSACAHAHIDTLLVKIGVVSYLELL